MSTCSTPNLGRVISHFRHLKSTRQSGTPRVSDEPANVARVVAVLLGTAVWNWGAKGPWPGRAFLKPHPGPLGRFVG